MVRHTGVLFGLATAVALCAVPGYRAADEDKAQPEASEPRGEQFADRTIQILELMHKDHVKRPPLADLVRWAVEGIYREVDEPVPPGVAIRVDHAARFGPSGLKEALASARNRLTNRAALDVDRDVAAAVAGVFRHLEPTSDPKSWLDFDVPICILRREGPPKGIGLSLQKDGRTEFIRVATPYFGGPAYRAGVRAGERIVRIVERRPAKNDRPATTSVLDARGQTPEIVAGFLLGWPDTVFQLHLQLPDGSHEHVVEVRPGSWDSESVFGVGRGNDDRWQYTLADEPSIGYIRIGFFGRDTGNDLAKILTTQRGVRGWILDLRFNPGGLISAGYQTAQAFVGIRRIMSINAAGADSPSAIVYEGEEGAILKNRPVVCIINGNTERIAEIVAACLQDQNKALIVGERTAGQAEIQNIQPVLMGAADLKITTGVFIRPNGHNLSRYMSAGGRDDDWGVIPDAGMECRLSPKETDQLAAAFRDTAAIYDPKFRPKSTFRDRQLELALSALRVRIESN